MSTDTSYFTNRRTIREFTDKTPDPVLINSILESAMRAPTTGNMQLYSVVVTTSASGLESLRPLHFNQPASMAPVLLTICADVARFERWCRLSNAKPEFKNMQGLMAAIFDATLLAGQITSIAEIQGLGTCWLGTTTYNAPEIAQALHLPKGVVPIATLAMGYPANIPDQCERLPLDAWCHSEKYNLVSDQEILELYRVKDESEQNKIFVTENGKETLAQVFTDVRYPVTASDPFSEKFMTFLRDTGFKL